MIRRTVLTFVVGIAVTLGCELLASLFANMHTPGSTDIANFLAFFAGCIGVLAALWYFFGGEL